MSQVIPAPLAENSPENSPSSPFLPVLLILFFGSGCAALIYEVVWYQMLELAIGSTTISVGVLLAAFMGGLCIGSIGLPRLRTQMHPLRMYALIEIGIAAFGLLVWLGVPLIDRMYIAANGVGLPNMLLRALVAAICLLPPTALMGASLARGGPMDRIHAQRRFLVGIALRHQHHRRGVRSIASGILPAADVRRSGGDAGRGPHQPGGGSDQPRAGGAHAGAEKPRALVPL